MSSKAVAAIAAAAGVAALTGAAANMAAELGTCDPSAFHVGNGTQDAHPLKEKKAANAAECCAECAKNVQCGHFVFDADALICKIKAPPLNLSQLTYDPSLTAGARTAPPPTPRPAPAPHAPAPVEPPPLGFQPHIIFILADDLGA